MVVQRTTPSVVPQLTATFIEEEAGVDGGLVLLFGEMVCVVESLCVHTLTVVTMSTSDGPYGHRLVLGQVVRVPSGFVGCVSPHTNCPSNCQQQSTSAVGSDEDWGV